MWPNIFTKIYMHSGVSYTGCHFIFYFKAIAKLYLLNVRIKAPSWWLTYIKLLGRKGGELVINKIYGTKFIELFQVSG